MTGTTSYRLSWQVGHGFPTLEVINTRTFVAKGPIAYVPFSPGDQKYVWRLDYLDTGSPPTSEHEPLCWTVDEMLEQGWIEEVGA